MGSPFDAAMRAADRTLDGIFGELFLVEPVADEALEDDAGSVNGPRRADPVRAPLRVTMTFQEVGEDYYPTARGRAANTAQRRVGAEIKLSVLDRNLPWQPAAGDRYTRAKTGIVYIGRAPEPDDAGRIWIPVEAPK